MTSKKEISLALKEKRILIGSRRVMRDVKNGKVSSVFFANNAPSNVRKDLEYYANVSKIEVKEFGGNSVQLGEFCGKPFKILLVGIKNK